MDITGSILQYTDKSGVTKTGNEYKKAELIITNNDGYQGKEVHYCFTIFGKTMSRYNHKVGETVCISFKPESREYNGRWYTDLIGWKISKHWEDTTDHLDKVQLKAAEQADDDLPF